MRNSDNQLPRSTPEYQGMSSEALLSFLDDVEHEGIELHSLMVLRHGHVVAEGWWNPFREEQPHMLFSLSKSFTSTAVGLAIEEGLLSVNDTVISFFPEEAPASPYPHLADMRVRDLLSMATGHAEDTMAQEDKNWVKGFLSLPVEHPPGTHFVYNSGASYMLSAILHKLTGQNLVDYLQPRLFAPLGIEGAVWEACPRGINMGGTGLSLRTEDVAKFGQLYLQLGVWRGTRILSESWVKEASSWQISNGDGGESDWTHGYGYQFWRCQPKGVYRGAGAFGQYCIIMPEQDAVIVITIAAEKMQDVLKIVWKRLLPAMKAAALPHDEEAGSALAERLKKLAIHLLQLNSSSSMADSIAGKRYEFEKNDFEISAVVFFFREGAVNLSIENDRGVHLISCGVNAWSEGPTRFFNGKEFYLAASAAWRESDTLVMMFRLLGTPFWRSIDCKFEGNGLRLEVKQNFGMGPGDHQILAGKVHPTA